MRVACFVTCVFLGSVGFSQEYPLWFIHQGELPCANTAVGYVHASSYQDSAVAFAFRQAETAYVRQSRTNIRGSQAFWATEGGTFWMGSDVIEECDTATVALNPIDTMVSHGLVFVLAAPHGCEASLSNGATVSLSEKIAPAWLEAIPRDTKSYYAVGIAPQYFYEKSSWDEAERLARRNLARTVCSTVKSLQKASTTESQDIRYEELSVTLKDYRIIERWFDCDKKLFYVLVRMMRE